MRSQPKMINEVPDIFEYNPILNGGTERMGLKFHNHVLDKMNNIKKYNCVIVPGCRNNLLQEYVDNEDKEIIMWVHNLPSQFSYETLTLMRSHKFIKKVKKIIAVSEWHKNEIIKEIGIDENLVHVIHNTFDPVEKDLEKFNDVDNVKLLWTSGGERGLTILLNSIVELGDKNITLNILGNGVPGLFDEHGHASNINHPGIKYHGRVSKREVLTLLKESHIFAYPSIYKETFCISLVEAISANMVTIYPKLGALEEIGSGIGISYDYEDDYKKHQDILTENLSKSISLIRSGNYNPGNQSELMNEKYSLDKFIQSWLTLDKEL